MSIFITLFVLKNDRRDVIGKIKLDNWFFEGVKSVKKKAGVKIDLAVFFYLSLERRVILAEFIGDRFNRESVRRGSLANNRTADRASKKSGELGSAD